MPAERDPSAPSRQPAAAVRAHLEYLRDLGIYEFYRTGTLVELEPLPDGPAAATSSAPERLPVEATAAAAPPVATPVPVPLRPQPAIAIQTVSPTPYPELDIPRPPSFNEMQPLTPLRVAPAARADALTAIQTEIGDCTRCPLAYAGRRKIVFGDGDPNARLMFVGEGPGADEDEQGRPFVGKSGQLLNNMIAAMGLRREQVYIANIVKCRPPANRAPEPVEANTCTQFLVRQMDAVAPEYVVALGSTAALYLLGVKQSLASLRGHWHNVRGARAVVTYHPAYLLRDPRQKAEAWKDLQLVMSAMGLKRG